MARGKKLDIFIGANIKDEWAQVQTPQKKSPTNEVVEPQKHFLVFKKEKRRSKTVTLVGEFLLTKNDATTLLKQLKKKLGCGGSYKDNWMEFQGDLKDKLRPLLVAAQFRFKHGH